jgi:hypothetical protein
MLSTKSLVVELGIRLAKVEPLITSVGRAGLGSHIRGVLVSVLADLTSVAPDLDTSTLTLTGTSRAKLDVLPVERASSTSRTSTIDVAQVPVQVVRESILILKNGRLWAGVTTNLHTSSGSATVEIVIPDGVSGNPSDSRLRVGTMGCANKDIIVAPDS